MDIGVFCLSSSAEKNDVENLSYLLRVKLINLCYSWLITDKK